MRLRQALLTVAVCILGVPAAASASAPPTAVISADAHPRWDRPAAFDASGSYDSDGNVVSYAWDLDEDNQFDDGTGATAQQSYAYPGLHVVRVRVTDDSGDSAIAERTFYVLGSNSQPLVSVDADRRTTHPGRPVELDAHALDLDGSIASYAWDLDEDGAFDDATTSATTASFDSVGTHRVAVRVSDDEGATAVGLLRIEVHAGNDPPQVGIEGEPFREGYELGRGERAQVYFWDDDSDGEVVSSAWDLDEDGQYDDSTQRTTDVSFATSGVHTVRLRVTDDEGASTDTQRTVRVHEGNLDPEVTIAQENEYARYRTGRAVSLAARTKDRDGYVVSYAWDLDSDGSFDDGNQYSASPTFSTDGEHHVRVRVRDNEGGSEVGGLTVTTRSDNEPPVARFRWYHAETYLPIRAGAQITFEAEGWDRDDAPQSPEWSWDLDDDGEFDDAPFGTAWHTFDAPGVYRVRVRATDSDGATSVAEHDVEVGPASLPPRADAWVWPNPPRAGRTLHLSASNSIDDDGGPLTYAWDLDEDGNFDDGELRDVTARFPTAGAHYARVRVTDDEGDSDVAQVDFDVTEANRPPTAEIDPYNDPLPAEVGERVRLSGSGDDSDGAVTERAWDLDDDGEFDDALGNHATTTFTSTGTHVVRLRVSDDEGAASIATATLTVATSGSAAPYLYLQAYRRSPRTGQEVAFDAFAPPGARVRWDLDGDGEFDDASGRRVTAAFATSGPHVVEARAAFASGATATRRLGLAVHDGNLPPRGVVWPGSPSGATRLLAGEPMLLDAQASDPDGSVVSVEWDLDDDGRYEDADKSLWPILRTFSEPGAHLVRARITDDGGATTVVRNAVNVSAPTPSEVEIETEADAPKVGAVTLSAHYADYAAIPVEFAWDTDDDGQFDDGYEQSLTARFDTPGTRTVRVRVTSNRGLESTGTRELDIHAGNYAPEVGLTASPAEPRVGTAVRFDARGEDRDGRVAKYEWDLDDDGEFDDPSSDEWHGTAYRGGFSAGPHVVRVRATDDSGGTDIAELTIDAHEENRAPHAVITVEPGSVTTGQRVLLKGWDSTDDTGGDLDYHWDLDDDGTFELIGHDHSLAFSTPGTHTVRLRVFDEAGLPDDASLDIVVLRENQAPRAAFDIAPATPRVGDEVVFDSRSSDADGTVATQQWDLDDDGQFDDASGPQARMRYTAAGTYDVRLRATDDEGLADVGRRTVNVKAVAPPVDPPPAPQQPPVVIDPPPGGPGVPAQPQPPGLPARDRMRLLSRNQRLTTVLRRGLALSVSCPAGCKPWIELRVSGATARRFHLPSRLIGQAEPRVAEGRARTVRVRVTGRVRRLLRDARKVELVVAGVGSPLRVVLRR